MLVYIQNDAVTFFGGISFWKKHFNRTIKRDAKPYIILAPNGPVMLVYDVMETEEGIDRAFKKLDTIKDQIVWWESGSQPPQLLADGEVTMSTDLLPRRLRRVLTRRKCANRMAPSFTERPPSGARASRVKAKSSR